MAPKYLCCLPLRFGVLLISFVNFLATAIVCAFFAGILILNAEGKELQFTEDGQTTDLVLTGKYKTIAIVVAAVYGFMAVISLTGLIGAIRKSESMVRVFSIVCKLLLTLQIALSTAVIVLFFTNKSELQRLCVGDSTNSDLVKDCNDFINEKRWSLVVSTVVPILFQAYGVYVISAYDHKLRMESDSVPMYRSGPGYTKVAGEEAYPLTQPHYTTGGYSDAAQKV